MSELLKSTKSNESRVINARFVTEIKPSISELVEDTEFVLVTLTLP